MQYLIKRFNYHICIWLLEIQNNTIEVLFCFLSSFSLLVLDVKVNLSSIRKQFKIVRWLYELPSETHFNACQ